jgi:repressor LexA
MTPIQQSVYQFIRDYIQSYNYAPSFTEIAVGVGISPKSKSFIHSCVHALAEKGWLLVDAKRRWRNIRLASSTARAIPVMGAIVAGETFAPASQPETIDVGALFSAEDHYILKVKGDTLLESGILEGDWLICKKTVPKEGDNVIVLIGHHQQATLRRLSYQIKDKITLISANPTLKPTSYSPERVQIQGVFVGLVRSC